MTMLKGSLASKLILGFLVLMGVFAVACNGSDAATQAPAPTTVPAATTTPTTAAGGALPTPNTELVIATATPPPVAQPTPAPEPVVTSTSGRLVTATRGLYL